MSLRSSHEARFEEVTRYEKNGKSKSRIPLNFKDSKDHPESTRRWLGPYLAAEHSLMDAPFNKNRIRRSNVFHLTSEAYHHDIVNLVNHGKPFYKWHEVLSGLVCDKTW